MEIFILVLTMSSFGIYFLKRSSKQEQAWTSGNILEQAATSLKRPQQPGITRSKME